MTLILATLIELASAGGPPACFDIRATTFLRCPDGQTRVFVQGHCEYEYEAVDSYCVPEDEADTSGDWPRPKAE